MSENWLTVTSPDGPMRLFVVRPGSPQPLPGVVVLQEAFGVNDHIQDVCRHYAGEGYVVVSPDMFHRYGVNTLPYSDIDAAKRLIAGISQDQIAADIGAAVDALRADPGVRSSDIGVVGYCFGGHCAYLAATRFPELKAVVVYYGGRIVTDGPDALVNATPAISSPVLAHFGGMDASIPPDQVAAIRQALDAADVDNLVVTYPGAGHGFACDARPGSFHAEAAASSWQLSSAFFKAAFAGDSRPAKAAAAAAGVGATGE